MSILWWSRFALALIAAGLLAAQSSAPASAGMLAPADTVVRTSAGAQDVRPAVMGVAAWGDNAKGQLDVPARARSRVTAIAAGNGFSLALKNGKVISWGDVGCQSWLGDMNQVAQPELDGVDAITARDCQAMALRDGEVIAWGFAYSNPALSLPAEVKSDVTAIATSHAVSLAVKGGRVIAWGGGTVSQMVVPVEAQTGVTDVATVQAFSMALKNNGQVITWGRPEGDPLLQVPDEAQSGVTAIATNGSQAMALKDGAVIAWGDNSAGQTDVPMEARSGVTAIAATQGNGSTAWDPAGPWYQEGGGNAFVPGGRLYAVKDGSVLTWGIKSTVKDGDVLTRAINSWGGDIDVPLEAQSGVTAIAASDNHALALVPATARVKVKPIKGRSKLFVNVNPNKGKGYWRFQVQKKRADGTWRSLKTYRTKGKKETRKLNRKQGTYRVWVKPKYGYQGVMSAEVYLKR